MHTPLSITAEHALTQLKAAAGKELQEEKNLVYYASGRRIPEEYFALPYDYVVLIDKAFPRPFRIRKNVITLGFTALEATAILREAGATFETFVCINEGLVQGGGTYAIHANWSMGTILPLLKEEYIHVACPTYYNSSWWKKMTNLPEERELLAPEEEGYLDPAIFTSYPRWAETARVWRVKKQRGELRGFYSGSRDLYVQRKNSWENYAQLDVLFVHCFEPEADTMERLFPKVKAYRSQSFEKLLQYCQEHKVVRLGLTPWLGGKYHRFLNFLKLHEREYPYPYQVNFYHLHKNDFKELYALARQTEEEDANELARIPKSHFRRWNREFAHLEMDKLKKMKAFYIHGLESNGLSAEKREKLEALGLEVTAPIFDFKGEKNMLEQIVAQIEQLRSHYPDFLIGSSMGGRMAFYLSNRLGLPTLLFNPALNLPLANELQPIPEDFRKLPVHPYQQFIFGGKDTTVPPETTRQFLADNYPDTPFREKVLPELAHQIPPAVLEEETDSFRDFLLQHRNLLESTQPLVAANTIIAYLLQHIEKDEKEFNHIKGRYLYLFEAHPQYSRIYDEVMEEIGRRNQDYW